VAITHASQEKINQDFPFFAELHRHLCGRPNTIPPVVTTGVGPSGQHVVQFQPIEEPPRSQAASRASLAQTKDTTPDGKENVWLSTSSSLKSQKRGPKVSSFTISDEKLKNAQSSIKRVTKKSFEDRLADATECVFFLLDDFTFEC
jgi:hypothetical protein